MTVLPGWVLLATSAVAAVTDVAWRRIPNALTLTAAAVGLATGIAQEISPAVRLGLPSLPEMGLCAAASLAVTVPLWRRGALGGGDAKLLAVVAIWAGAVNAVEIAFASCASGLVLALSAAACRGQLRASGGAAGTTHDAPAAATVPLRRQHFPFGVAVFAGTCAWWLRERLA